MVVLTTMRYMCGSHTGRSRLSDGPLCLSLSQLCALGLYIVSGGAVIAALPDSLTVDVGNIDEDPESEVLVLTKRSMRSATHYQVKTWDRINGYQNYPAPEVRTYRGYVQDDPDMLVNANIEEGNILNANLSDGRNINLRLTQLPVVVNGPSGTPFIGNGNTVVPLEVQRSSPTTAGYIIPRYTMRRIHMAAEIQNDYYVDLDRNVDLAVARMEQRVNDTDFFYARDMGIAWEITTIVVRLDELTTNWKDQWKQVLAPGGSVYNVAVNFKRPGGGGASGSIFDPNDPNHRVYCTVGTTHAYSRALGHEVGHQFGAGHRSSWEDIMESAGSCLGAGTVERLIDHGHIALEAAAPAVIYGAPVPPYAMEDGANTMQDQPLKIDLLENDYDGNGDSVILERVDPVTTNGGSVQVVSGGIVRYTPAPGFLGMDEFTYSVADPGGLTNRHGYAKIYVRNNGLAAHFKFDENSGSFIMDSGPYEAHGQFTGGLSYANSVPGKMGAALERTANDGLEASADFEGVGDPMEGDLSVSLWVKYSSVPTGDGVLICKGGAVIPNRFDNPRGGWFVGHVEGKGFRFAGNLQRDLWQNTEKFDRESATPIKANTWYHLVMVINRSTKSIRAWVDGEEVMNSNWTSFVPDGLINSTHSPMVIFNSKAQRSQSEWFGPVIVDDVRIYNTSLSPLEVEILRVGNNPNETNRKFKLSVLQNPENRAISWHSVSGISYSLLHSEGLGSDDWTVIASGIAGSDGTKTVLDDDPGRLAKDHGFYRLVVE